MKTKKTTIVASLFLFSLLFLLTFCDKKEKQSSINFDKITISDFYHSGCEGNTTDSRSETIELPEKLNIKLVEDSSLVFKHSNTVFNCCPGNLSASAEIEGTTIKIEEKEEKKGCKCNCSYTLNYKVSPIQKKTYTINIKGYEPFQLKVKDGLDTTIVLNKN